MSYSSIEIPAIDKVMVSQDEMDKAARFIGYDDAYRRTGSRRARLSSSPDFIVDVGYSDGSFRDYLATVVVNNVPEVGGLEEGEPVAIAMVNIDDEELFMLFHVRCGSLETSDKLIPYDGEPEELLQKMHLFDEVE